MEGSAKGAKSKAQKAKATKKNAEVQDILSVGRVDPQVLKSYIGGFPNLVEETQAKPSKTTTKTKNFTPTDLNGLECILKDTKPRKTSPTSLKIQPVIADNSKGRKGTTKKLTTVEHFDSFALVSKLLDRPFIPGNEVVLPKIQRSKSKSSDKQEPTSRSLRSSNRYAVFDDEHSDSVSFSIYSIDWYILNKDFYDKKLSTILSDFEIPKENRRDGNAKTCYNYLLLDSRKCRDARGVSWESFIDAIFYLGKGKNQRSKSHTKAAEEYYSMNKHSSSKKIEKIIEIWRAGCPVLLFEFAKNIISEEAYTREALMIDAIGKGRSCNVRSGTYYGVAATMKPIEKQRMGTIVLMEARKQFIVTGACEELPKYTSKNLNIPEIVKARDNKLKNIF